MPTPRTSPKLPDPATLTDSQLDELTKPPVVAIDVDSHGDVDLDALPTLDDAPPTIDHEAEEKTVSLDVQRQRQFETDHQVVVIRIRRNLTRTKIGDTWYTLKKGEEREVPRWVADWLSEQGYL